MLDVRSIFLAVFLASQAMLVHWVERREVPPQPPELSRLPAVLGQWQQIGESPINAEVARELGADRALSRTYVDGGGARPVDLFVAWFQSQRGGASQPHSPKVCLPGAGWTPVASDEITLATSAGAIPVNRYIVFKSTQGQGQERAVVVYWYQTSQRTIAGEWAAKFWVVADGLRYRRTDIFLVRVIAWSKDGNDAEAEARAVGFAQATQRWLRTMATAAAAPPARRLL